MIESLERAIIEDSSDAVQDAIFDLGQTNKIDGLLADEIVFGIIDILRRDEMKLSALSGHIFNYFQYESEFISGKAKDRCVGFINAWGNDFEHFHSVHVISELKTGGYLKYNHTSTKTITDCIRFARQFYGR